MKTFLFIALLGTSLAIAHLQVQVSVLKKAEERRMVITKQLERQHDQYADELRKTIASISECTLTIVHRVVIENKDLAARKKNKRKTRIASSAIRSDYSQLAQRNR